jgi:hypothetical protein
VFKNLKLLQYVLLSLFNLKGFVHGNGIEWMSYLGPNSPELLPDSFKGQNESTCNITCQNLLNSLVAVILDDGVRIFDSKLPVDFFPNLRYTFPEADFCTFANYSFNKLIVVTWSAMFGKNDSSLVSNCSCSMLWLFKNLELVMNFPSYTLVQLIMGYEKQKFCNPNDHVSFSMAYDACNFSARLENCLLKVTGQNKAENNYDDPYFQLYDIQSFLSQASNFLSGGINIGVSIFSLVTNLATAVVILNARRHHKAQGPVFKKDDELNSIGEVFFTYMLLNAVINVAFSLFFLLTTCITCIPTPVNEQLVHVTGCLITNMCVAGVVSLMKLMSNSTSLQMSMNRYLLVGKDHAKWVEKVAKANIGITMTIAFFASCLLSLVSVYQVYYFDGFNLSENNGNEYNSYFYYHSYLWGFVDDIRNNLNQMYSINVANLDSVINMLPLVFTLTVLHDLFSYFIFCFFNLALDVMTVKKLKESLAEKARLSSTNKQDEQMRAERRSVIMVVLNSIVNILIRLPELLAIGFFFALAVVSNHKYPFKVLCYDFDQCLTLGQISNTFFVFSLSFNVFFYYYFNETFKFAFQLTLSCNADRREPNKN